LVGENAGNRGCCMGGSIIEVPDRKLMTIDIPHGPEKVFEKFPENTGKN